MRHTPSVRIALVAVFGAIASFCCGCADTEESVRVAGSESLTSPVTIVLPAPSTSGSMTLEEAIAARRSLRGFSAEALGLQDLSQLLWSAQGITEVGGRGRAAPSAGGTYPLELYLVSSMGLHHYLPSTHSLEVLGAEDLRRDLAEAALGQQHVADAAAVVVITAVFARTEERYGQRAERYVVLEAGHAAQNLLLQAVAMDLGAVPVGAFRDEEVSALLGLPPDHAPLYLIAVGPVRDR